MNLTYENYRRTTAMLYFDDLRNIGQGYFICPKSEHIYYKGQVKNRKKVGMGELYDIDTGLLVYKGMFKDDYPEDIDGQFFSTETGKVSYKGGFRKGKKARKGKIFFEEEFERNYFIWSEARTNFNEDLVDVKQKFNKEKVIEILTLYNKGHLKTDGLIDENFKKQGKCKVYYYNGMLEKTGNFLDDLEEDKEFQINRMFGGMLFMGGMSKGFYEGYGELFARKNKLEYKGIKPFFNNKLGFFKEGQPDGENVTVYNSKGKIEYQGSMKNG